MRKKRAAGWLVALLLTAGCGSSSDRRDEPTEWPTSDPENTALLELFLMTPEERREFCRVYEEGGAQAIRDLPRVIDDWDDVVEAMVKEAERGC